jgi:hypothetical protein
MGYPFDIEKLLLSPEMVVSMNEAWRRLQAEHRQASKAGHFVKLPYEQTLVAAGKLGSSELAVLVELAYQAFRTHKTEVPLPNKALRSVGVSPDAKVRTLRRLEATGMVKVDWRGGSKTPLVTLLWT